MSKKAATFSLDEEIIALIPAIMKVKNWKYTKSDFIAYCVAEEAIKYRTDSLRVTKLLRDYLGK